MKTLLAIMLSLFTVTVAQATDWQACVRYWYFQNVSTNVPHTLEIVSMYGNDNASVQIGWLIPGPHPTREQLIALEPAALVWQSNREKDSKAAIKEVSPEVVKAIVAAIVKTVNKRLPADKQISAPEMTDAIKGELP
jgi:hypothetical protein